MTNELLSYTVPHSPYSSIKFYGCLTLQYASSQTLYGALLEIKLALAQSLYDEANLSYKIFK